MSGRINEGMSRTRRPHGSVRAGRDRGRVALAALLALLLLLTLGWVSVLGGDDGREAQAQSSGSESEGAVQSEGDAGTIPDRDPDYAAFGEERNPFSPVLSQAETDDTAAEADTGGGGAEADANTDGNGAESRTGNEGGPSAKAGDGTDTTDDTTGGQTATNQNGANDGNNTAQPPTGGDPAKDNTVTAPNGDQVDCGNPEDEFERVICEDERNGGGDGGNGGGGDGADQTGSGGGQGPPGSGGSGRSGTGEPTDDFRNGGNAGGGVAK